MGVQVAVSYGESCREVAAQLLQQLREGSLLGLERERPAGMYPAVACDVVMVADVAEVPAVDMVPAAILERVRLPAARGAAMDDE